MSKETNDKSKLDIELDKILQVAIVGENFVSYNEYGQEAADKARKQILSLIEAEVEKAVMDERLHMLKLKHNTLCQIADGEETVDTWIKWNKKDIKNIERRTKWQN